MAYVGLGLTSVRRAVGLVAVLFLLGCAVYYATVPGFPILGFSAGTPAGSYASPVHSTVADQSTGTGQSSWSADPSQAAEPVPSASTTTPGADGTTAAGSGRDEPIQVLVPAGSAKPFEAVQIRGTYRGGPDTLLRVQRWEGGIWLDFPVPTRTDRSGRFTAHIEFGAPGRYWVRLLDPESGVESKPFQLVVKK
jgi:hypothetical protein